jgi:hypothetical protein
MSSIIRSEGASSRSISAQSDVNSPPADIGAEVEPGPRIHEALSFHRRPSSISTSDSSYTPPDPWPPLLSQAISGPSSPTSGLPEPRFSLRVAGPGRRHESSRSSLDESRLSSETLTPPTSNEMSPASQSAGITQQSAPSSLRATPSHIPRLLTVRPRSDNDDHRPNSRSLPPHSRSSQWSLSGSTLVDESETPPDLGSAILLGGSTRLPQRFYEAYRYELLQR